MKTWRKNKKGNTANKINIIKAGFLPVTISLPSIITYNFCKLPCVSNFSRHRKKLCKNQFEVMSVTVVIMLNIMLKLKHMWLKRRKRRLHRTNIQRQRNRMSKRTEAEMCQNQGQIWSRAASLEGRKSVCSSWKNVLAGKKNSSRPFTQHSPKTWKRFRSSILWVWECCL